MPGSHRALPGGPGGAPGGRPSAPTAMDGSDDDPRRGKGVNKNTTASDQCTWSMRCMHVFLQAYPRNTKHGKGRTRLCAAGLRRYIVPSLQAMCMSQSGTVHVQRASCAELATPLPLSHTVLMTQAVGDRSSHPPVPPCSARPWRPVPAAPPSQGQTRRTSTPHAHHRD